MMTDNPTSDRRHSQSVRGKEESTKAALVQKLRRTKRCGHYTHTFTILSTEHQELSKALRYNLSKLFIFFFRFLKCWIITFLDEQDDSIGKPIPQTSKLWSLQLTADVTISTAKMDQENNTLMKRSEVRHIQLLSKKVLKSTTLPLQVFGGRESIPSVHKTKKQ
jgi:hypothetical protein